jgi:DNA-binding transcriptional LysR family regulator
MPRNLDLTAVRAFVAVVDAGGVTKASGFLNLTQSAVSMQLKRLEESIGVALFDRSARRLALTGAGEQMLGYARRLLDLNDEVLGRLTATDYTGQITLGVPHDIVYPRFRRCFSGSTPTFRACACNWCRPTRRGSRRCSRAVRST